jgi:hypothetical protein
MLGIGIITKHGLDNQKAYHQHQDSVVITTEENVVYGQFHQEVLLQYLKCGAVEHQEQVAVAVCKVIQEMEDLTQLNQLT